MLYFPERIRNGDVPNVDFLHLYGPGSLDVLAGWYAVFGDSLPAERTFGLLQHLGIILGLFTLGPGLGTPGGDRRGRAVGLLHPHPDRPHGDGVERRTGPDAVERGLRAPRRAPRRRPPATTGLGRRRRAGRAGPDLSPGPRDRPRPGAGLVAVAPGCESPARPDRRRDRPAADLGAPRHGRTGEGLRGHVPGPGVPAAGRSGAAPTALVGSPGRGPAGGRRGDPALVEVPPPLGVAHAVPVVLPDAGGGVRPRRLRGVAAARAIARLGALDGAARRQRWSASASCPRPCSVPTPPTSCGSPAWRSRSASSP